MSNLVKSTVQRLKILYLYQILTKYTDENHALTMPEIIAKLESYGISAARKALYEDIEALKLYGLDIVDSKGRNADYRVVSRDFELAELKLLADAVTSSKFLTEKKSRALTKKISSLCSVYEAKNIQRQVFVSGRVKSINEMIYITVDAVHQAISDSRQISFRYFSYDTANNKVYHGKRRICSPYALVWDDEKYYMVAYCEKRKTIVNFRVDRMESVEISDVPSRPHPVGFDLPEYLNATFSMFAGESTTVKLKIDNDLVNVVHDRFGKNAKMVPYDDGHFTVTAPVKVQAPFFGWLFQFGGKITILSPSEVSEQYEAMLKNAVDMLENKPSHIL
ncbi:MAG: helix-turn-helix transcriptional regulator [Oscillospiraceae bacterium]